MKKEVGWEGRRVQGRRVKEEDRGRIEVKSYGAVNGYVSFDVYPRH